MKKLVKYKLLLLSLLDFRKHLDSNKYISSDDLLRSQLKSHAVSFDADLLEYLYSYLSNHIDFLKRAEIKYIQHDNKFLLSYVDNKVENGEQQIEGMMEYIGLVGDEIAPVKKEITRFEKKGDNKKVQREASFSTVYGIELIKLLTNSVKSTDKEKTIADLNEELADKDYEIMAYRNLLDLALVILVNSDGAVNRCLSGNIIDIDEKHLTEFENEESLKLAISDFWKEYEESFEENSFYFPNKVRGILKRIIDFNNYYNSNIYEDSGKEKTDKYNIYGKIDDDIVKYMMLVESNIEGRYKSK